MILAGLLNVFGVAGERYMLEHCGGLTRSSDRRCPRRTLLRCDRCQLTKWIRDSCAPASFATKTLRSCKMPKFRRDERRLLRKFNLTCSLPINLQTVAAWAYLNVTARVQTFLLRAVRSSEAAAMLLSLSRGKFKCND